jgi:AcrR family transcriptional regulator
MNVDSAIRLARAKERQQVVVGLLTALERRDVAALREADVIEAAGVSTSTFHELFGGLDECFDFACEAGLDVLLGPMVAAWSVPRRRPERLGAALTALLGALAAQPRLAKLCLVHSPVRQPDRRTYRRLVDSLAELLLDVRRPFAAPQSPPSTAGEQTLAQSAVGLIAVHLEDGGGTSFEELRLRLLGLLVPAVELDATD